MVKAYLIVDESILLKMDYTYIGSTLSEIQKENSDNPDQKIAVFIICTVSTIRRRVGKWKSEDWIHYALRIPRETVDALNRDEVSELVIGLVKKAFNWEGKAEAA
jgi:hypothetical protein